MPSSHLILCRPLLLLPPNPPSIRVCSNESTLRMRWPKYWNFSFSIIPYKVHPGLISFRMDWLDLLAVQGTLESRLQHHSSKASILLPASGSFQMSQFFASGGQNIICYKSPPKSGFSLSASGMLAFLENYFPALLLGRCTSFPGLK